MAESAMRSELSYLLVLERGGLVRYILSPRRETLCEPSWRCGVGCVASY